MIYQNHHSHRFLWPLTFAPAQNLELAPVRNLTPHSRQLRRTTLIATGNKMRSEIADFAPVQPGGVLDQAVFSGVHLVPPPGELDETRASLLFLAHSLHYAKP